MNKIYIKPYARMGPYIVGLLLGYFIIIVEGRNVKLKNVNQTDQCYSQFVLLVDIFLI
jgi:hypothetical protein